MKSLFRGRPARCAPPSSAYARRSADRVGPASCRRTAYRTFGAFAIVVSCLCSPAFPQSGTASGTVTGVVDDPSGAAVPGASVEIVNALSGYQRSRLTDGRGSFTFSNLPPNPYRLTVNKEGFATSGQDLDVRSSVPVSLKVDLRLGVTTASVTVEASSLLEREPTAHTDVDRNLFDKLPLESASSGLSSLVTLSTPGVVADSNGLFHGLGDHAENQFSIDGQPITDQQSKVFSNQLPVDAVESLEVISGLPPAEFGDKNSLVIKVVTRSGLDDVGTHGSINAGYGTFRAPAGGFTLAFGNGTWGNFLSVNGLRTDRFLDPPESEAIHARGDQQNVFDRVDWRGSGSDSFHVNLGYTRSNFEIPNTYDQAATNQDQHQRLETFNIAPGWTHTFGSAALLTVTGFLRHDNVQYFPSSDVLADQPVTLSQTRTLTNAGAQATVSWVHGVHSLQGGFQYAHWSLSEKFGFGITDPAFNAPCIDDGGSPVAGGSDPGQCAALGDGFAASSGFLPGLLPYDLTRGGQNFAFDGTAGISEESLFVQDRMTFSHWTLDLGVRADNYDGLSHDRLLEPRVAVSYNIKGSNTLLRGGYGRFLETPFNENLIVSSSTGIGGLAGAYEATPIKPGHRDQFNAGLQQALGRHLVIDADYFWKYTNPAYDFDVLLSTPLTFPISWAKSKIDGVSARLSVPRTAGFSAYAILGHTRSRFFGPETGGIIFNSPVSGSVFRIDHDQALQSTVHLQYQPKERLPWVGFTWRYDSGLVAGAVPDYATALTLGADEQAAMGLYCGSQFATLQQPLTGCPAGVSRGATRVRIPADGAEDDDHNPPRIAPRNLLDLSAGIDDLLAGRGLKVGLRVSVINLTNTVALYNFLSTFSGTHFVTPRAVQADVVLRF